MLLLLFARFLSLTYSVRFFFFVFLFFVHCRCRTYVSHFLHKFFFCRTRNFHIFFFSIFCWYKSKLALLKCMLMPKCFVQFDLIIFIVFSHTLLILFNAIFWLKFDFLVCVVFVLVSVYCCTFLFCFSITFCSLSIYTKREIDCKLLKNAIEKPNETQKLR